MHSTAAKPGKVMSTYEGIIDPTSRDSMSDTLRLLLALLDIAPEMKRLLGAEWPRFRDELLVLAGRLEQEDDATGTDLDALIERLLAEAPPEGQELVRRAMQEERPAEYDEAAFRRDSATGEVAQPAAEEIGGVARSRCSMAPIAPRAAADPRTTIPAGAALRHSGLPASAFR
jgi:hypothetical protein